MLAALTVIGCGWLWTALAGGAQPYETYESRVALDGPVAQFRFDDASGSGKVVDSVGSYTATNSGIVLGGEGPFGGSKSGLFGGSAYATLAGYPLEGASEFTAEGWVYWVGGTTYGEPIFAFGSGESSYMVLTPAASSPHKLAFEIHASGKTFQVVGERKLTVEAWEYVVVTESGGTLRLYVNGKEVGQTTGVALTPASLGSTSKDYLGNTPVSGTPLFKGSLSNVAFYSKALSGSAILAHYDDGEYPVNTVLPTISGTARQGKQLTAKANTWTGLTPISFLYQWERCNTAGGECTTLGSGSSETKYTLENNDAGHKMRVAVTGSNSAGEGTATSATTATVEGLKPSNTTLPAISGTTEGGQVLSVGEGSWEGTTPLAYSYQWQVCNSSGGSCKNIAEATSPTYRVLVEQIGDTLRATVTASNSIGSKGATSAVTRAITPGPPVNTELPSIIGDAGENQTLSAATGGWISAEPLSYTYQWERCYGSGGSCTNISNAIASTYHATDADVGTTLQVVVTAKNSVGAGGATSEDTGIVEPSEPVADAPPVIDGVAREGEVLYASSGLWGGSPQVRYDYQWEDCEPLGESCLPIAGADEPTYLLVPGDVGHAVRVVVTAVDIENVSAIASNTTAVVEAGPYFVSQMAGSGESTLSEPSDVAVDEHENVWIVNAGNDTVEKFGQGDELLERFGRRGEGYGALERPAGIAVAKGHVWVADAGNQRIEEFSESGEYVRSITAIVGGQGGHIVNPGGVAVDQHGNVWVSDIGNGRVDEFTEEGEFVDSFGVSGMQPGGIAIDARGDVWVVDPPQSRVYEFGENGELLRYWGSKGEGDGEMARPYGITVDDQGDVWIGDVRNERVQEFTETGEYLGQFGSYGHGPGQFGLEEPMGLATDAQGDIWVTDWYNDRIQVWHGDSTAPANQTPPTITGDAIVGETLGASAGTWSGAPVRYAYQWQRCNASGEECTNVGGATGQTYAPSEEDLGATVRVIVSAINTGGAVGVPSTATATISRPTAPASTAAPAIAGVAQDGQTLSASTGSWSGTPPTSYSYRWESCNASGEGCSTIEGAESAEYALGDGDIGATLRAIVTATNAAGSAPATSPASGKVEAEPPSELQPPSISGVPDARNILYAGAGAWTGTGRRFSYQWESCDANGANCAAVSGATGSEYDPAETDVGATLRVRVAAESSLGSLTDVSPATPVIGAAGALASATEPSIAGTSRVGQTLTASAGNWSDGEGAAIGYTYQWQTCDRFGGSCEDVEGATSPNYSPVADEVGSALRVQVTANDKEGTRSLTSAATEPIAAAAAPVLEKPPVVMGTTLAGHVLTVTAGHWQAEASAAYSYQWERCSDEGHCVAIEGATASSYSIGEREVGATLLAVVTATDTGGSTSALSLSTATVEPESLQVLSVPTISGVVELEGVLGAEPGVWSGVGPVAYAYQWERCNGSGEECAPIEGANEPVYVLGGHTGSTLRVAVTATNPLGSRSALSAPTPATPGGVVSVEETQNVAQEADPAVLAPATSAHLEEQTIAPALGDSEELSSQQALTSSTVSKQTPGEFAVNTPDGQLSLTPVESSSEATTTPTLVNGAVALFANTSPATDTIVRPDALGATTLLQLRSSEAPSSFSWSVGLGADQELRQLPNGSVAVTSASEAAGGSEVSQEPESRETGEGTPETSEEKATAEREEAESETEVETKPPPAAPKTSTPPAEPPPGELQPQNTQAQYEAATSATAYAEARTGGTTLMVIAPPQAVDAHGDEVPASLSIQGDTITLQLKPTESTAYPAYAAVAVAAPSDKTSSERDPFEYGLADEQPSHFGAHLDKKLETGPLKIKTARIFVPYDTVVRSEEAKERASNEGHTERQRLNEWLEAVRVDGLQPYITLQHSKYRGRPSISRYREAVKAFMEDYRGKVKYWGAWNEPDLGENVLPAGRAADFWQAAQSVELEVGCRCTIVAGEFHQYNEHQDKAYASKYRQTVLEYCGQCWGQRRTSWRLHGRPAIWGLHDYKDVVEYGDHSTDLRKFEEFADGSLGKPRLWIGEAGVQLDNGHETTRLVGKTGPADFALQTAAANAFLGLHSTLGQGEKISRIDRVYYYSYEAPTEVEIERNKANRRETFDSGLIESAPENKHRSYGEVRPAYCVLAYASHDCPPTVLATFPPVVNGEMSGLVNPHGLETTVTFEVDGSDEATKTIGPGVIHPVVVSGGKFGGGCSVYAYRVTATNAGGSATGSTVEINPECE